jgi:methylated-DNA-[protein]-cysteine S-methyltransferase
MEDRLTPIQLMAPGSFTTYYQSPVGLLRVSGTDQFVSELYFIDTADKIVENTGNEELPPMAINAIEQLIQYFHGNRRHFELPLYQQGTEFQQKVWHELMNIPFGKTISYLELSRRLGDTKVIRAAASANGKNNIAIIVPCHRVIGSNNELVGYGGGLWRKWWLLEHESKVAHGVQTLF